MRPRTAKLLTKSILGLGIFCLVAKFSMYVGILASLVITVKLMKAL